MTITKLILPLVFLASLAACQTTSPGQIAESPAAKVAPAGQPSQANEAGIPYGTLHIGRSDVSPISVVTINGVMYAIVDEQRQPFSLTGGELKDVFLGGFGRQTFNIKLNPQTGEGKHEIYHCNRNCIGSAKLIRSG